MGNEGAKDLARCTERQAALLGQPATIHGYVFNASPLVGISIVGNSLAAIVYLGASQKIGNLKRIRFPLDGDVGALRQFQNEILRHKGVGALVVEVGHE